MRMGQACGGRPTLSTHSCGQPAWKSRVMSGSVLQERPCARNHRCQTTGRMRDRRAGGERGTYPHDLTGRGGRKRPSRPTGCVTTRHSSKTSAKLRRRHGRTGSRGTYRGSIRDLAAGTPSPRPTRPSSAMLLGEAWEKGPGPIRRPTLPMPPMPSSYPAEGPAVLVQLSEHPVETRVARVERGGQSRTSTSGAVRCKPYFPAVVATTDSGSSAICACAAEKTSAAASAATSTAVANMAEEVRQRARQRGDKEISTD